MKAIKTAAQLNHPLAEQAPDYPVVIRTISDKSELLPSEQIVSDEELQALLDQYKDVVEQYRREQQALSRRRITLEAEAEAEEIDGKEVVKTARLQHDIETPGSFWGGDPNGAVAAWDPEGNRWVLIGVTGGVLTVLPASGSPRYSKQKLAKLREAKREKLAALKAEKVGDLVERAESATRVADMIKVVKSLAKRLAALEAAVTIQEE